MPVKVLITCEHGGNRIPRRYASWFVGREQLLMSHQGWDPGALPLARAFSNRLSAPLIASRTSRLLIELNRSISHPALFSAVSRRLSREDRDELIKRFYLPYRARVAAWIRRECRRDTVVHLGVHTFTPTLDQEIRVADVGLLYDPSRPLERSVCARWKRHLQDLEGELVIRRNYPYLGKSDGLTTSLRREFSNRKYVGIELEVNQKWNQRPRREILRLRNTLVDSFRLSLAESG